jgi:hypothetical protein
MKSARALVQALAIAAFAAGGGCRFEAPAYDGTRYACAPPDDRCPPGFACVDGFCTSGEGPPEGVDAGEVDTAPPVNTSSMRVAVAYDTSILSDATAQNGGAREFLEMDAAPRRVTLIELDLSGLPAAPVLSATLHVTVFDPLESGTFQLFPLTESWTEAGATWEEREPGVPWSGGLSVPTLDANALLGELAPRDIGNAIVALDETVVEGWLAAPATNHGFAIVSTSPDGRGGQLRSREYAAAPAERPFAIVTVAAP